MINRNVNSIFSSVSQFLSNLNPLGKLVVVRTTDFVFMSCHVPGPCVQSKTVFSTASSFFQISEYIQLQLQQPHVIMAAGTSSTPVANGTHASSKPIELAITLPHSPGTRIHLHLTVLTSSIMVFLTSTNMDAGQGGVAMGSFVYAMPDVRHIPLDFRRWKILTCCRDTTPTNL